MLPQCPMSLLPHLPHLFSFSPAFILKSPIFLTLFTVFPFYMPYLFLSTLSLLLAHCIFYSHPSVSFVFFVSFLLTLSSSSYFSFTLLFSSSFRLSGGKVEKVTVEMNVDCISLASPPLQIGFLLLSSHTMHNSSFPRSLSLIVDFCCPLSYFIFPILSSLFFWLSASISSHYLLVVSLHHCFCSLSYFSFCFVFCSPISFCLS